MTTIKEDTLNKNDNSGLVTKLYFTAVFITASVLMVINLNMSAVTWPASDNIPGVCRLLMSDCLINDFFTNASSTSSPRTPYVYLLAEITRIFNKGLGGGLAIIKSILLILLPGVVSYLYISAIKTHLNFSERMLWDCTDQNVMTVASAPIFVLFLQGKMGAMLSVAWWPPLYFEATAQNVALTLTIAGFLLVWGKNKFIGATLVFLGAIVHPVVCLLATIFSCIVLIKFDSNEENLNFFNVGVVASILGAVIMKLLFEESSSMNAQDFVKIYAMEAHPAHYIPSQFGSLSSIPWFISFSIVSFGLLAITVVLYRFKCLVWKNSFFAFAAYSLSVAIQYLFVEVMPIKHVAMLGPSRFTMFGPWFLCIFYFIGFYKLLEQKQIFKEASYMVKRCIRIISWFNINVLYCLLGVILIYYSNKASNFNLPENAKTLVDFTVEKTNKNDVFVLPFNSPRADFPLITGRAIFFGNGFPFSEKYFNEWNDRNILLNGRNEEIKNLPGSWIGEKYSNYYRKLLPSDFLKMSLKYKIDWVVIESDFSDNFSYCIPDNESTSYKVFSISALKICHR